MINYLDSYNSDELILTGPATFTKVSSNNGDSQRISLVVNFEYKGTWKDGLTGLRIRQPAPGGKEVVELLREEQRTYTFRRCMFSILAESKEVIVLKDSATFVLCIGEQAVLLLGEHEYNIVTHENTVKMLTSINDYVSLGQGSVVNDKSTIRLVTILGLSQSSRPSRPS
ncbi:hypothetical protein GQ44DRAFT_733055 [Phaeosphaeriaceae sp. PMI808]|nr:hypothetical protein GQ44DRAFT_733055 [Phaeosphaeriaceae sp. PMI808]